MMPGRSKITREAEWSLPRAASNGHELGAKPIAWGVVPVEEDRNNVNPKGTSWLRTDHSLN